jgi:glucose/arabinose dehydrogenase
VARGLVQPWGLALLPDGSALVTERNSRRIWEVRPGRAARVIYTVREAVSAGEGGLLGIAVGPDYARDRRVYLYFTTASDNRIAYVVRGSAARPRVVLRGIPAGRTHDGGRLLFGPDGTLYAGTGDAGVPARSQDRRNLGGKVLRMTKDGGVPAGSPFGTVVHSYGHRNVQGLAFDAAGRLWASELGQNRYDEVNLVVRGGNYGWPAGRGPQRRPALPRAGARLAAVGGVAERHGLQRRRPARRGAARPAALAARPVGDAGRAVERLLRGQLRPAADGAARPRRVAVAAHRQRQRRPGAAHRPPVGRRIGTGPPG